MFLLLFFAPWMTNDWCKKRITDYNVSNKVITTNWIPFGRKVEVRKPIDEWSNPPVLGGYGFDVFMTFWGKDFGFIGR